MIEIGRKYKSFFSKVMLAGEYLVIEGAPSLALPFPKYEGHWYHDGHSHFHDWEDFLIYLKNLPFLDNEKMVNDFSKGLHYESNIPVGYGLGSSGTLVASLYDLYGDNEKIDDERLKSALATMESFFHGKSSGLDPLVAYLNKPILFENGKVTVLENTQVRVENWQIYDSGISRKTGPLVDHFKNSIATKFKAELKDLETLNQTFIASFIGSDHDMPRLMPLFSELQFKIFHDIIDAKTRDIWEQGLLTAEYFMKLCGAGGGGMYLVYSAKGDSPFKTLAIEEQKPQS